MNDTIMKFYDSCPIKNRILRSDLIVYKDDNETYSWQAFIAAVPRRYNNIRDVDFEEILYPEDILYNMPRNYCAAYWVQKNGKDSNFKKYNELLDAVKVLMNKKGGAVRFSRPFEKSESITKKNVEKFEDLFKRDVEHPWRVNSQRLSHLSSDGHNLKYPCYVMEKMDGINCTIISHPKIPGKIDLYTREKKSYPSQQHLIRIAAPVLKKYPGLYFMGELCKPNYGMEIIYEKLKEPNNEELMFYPYDCFYVDKKRRKMPYLERWKLCVEIIKKIKSEYFVEQPLWKCDTRCEIHKYFLDVLNKNGEGLVIYNKDGVHKFTIGNNYIRSIDVFKYKLRSDKEYKIIDFKKDKDGSIIWIAQTNKGYKFNVYPVDKKIGVRDYKAQSKNFTAKNKLATIQFDGYSSGIPIQPIFLHIREFL